MSASNDAGSSYSARKENRENGKVSTLTREEENGEGASSSWMACESSDRARETKKTRRKSHQDGNQQFVPIHEKERKINSCNSTGSHAPRDDKNVATAGISNPQEQQLGANNKEVQNPDGDNHAVPPNKTKPHDNDEVLLPSGDEHASLSERSNPNEKKLGTTDEQVRQPNGDECAVLPGISNLQKISGMNDNEIPQPSFLTTAMWKKTPGSKTKSGSSPTNDNKAECSTRRIIDDDFNIGKDVSTDWSALACAPNYIAKTALNALSIPVVAAGYAVGKMGAASPLLNNGGLSNSTAFRYGFTSLLYANGVIPTLRGEDTSGDFRDAPLMVSNHLSYLDGITLATMLNVPKIIAKTELLDLPVLGQFMKDIDCLFVDRDSSDSKKKILDVIKKHAKEWQHGDRPLLIFPEGTTSNGKSVTSFYRGAFIPGKPVRPIVLFYHGDWNPCNPDKRRDGEEIIEYSDSDWALQFFGHLYHSITIKVLPIYTPSAEEQADAELYAKNVHRIVQNEYHLLKEEHRRERIQGSWKVAAGRESGSLDYEFGDETRAVLNTMSYWLGWSGTPEESREDDGQSRTSPKTKRRKQRRKERAVKKASFVDPFPQD
eukprot:GEMP01010704.1.p1 GENE.GEMP01010704.1~~GEMP01010704.1.p1  ORF type:complete len:603 (+),score=98.41 GEMP01010704.1:38-1846(+)